MLFSSSLVNAKTVSESSKFASFRISSSKASPLITIDDDSSLAISSALFCLFQLSLLLHPQNLTLTFLLDLIDITSTNDPNIFAVFLRDQKI